MSGHTSRQGSLAFAGIVSVETERRLRQGLGPEPLPQKVSIGWWPRAAQLSGGAIGVLYDGQLASEHASLLTRAPMTLLLACRDEDAPTAWEVQVARQILRGESLAPRQATIWEVPALRDISSICDSVVGLTTAARSSKAVTDAVVDVVHELAANALLDAPADAKGNPKYAHRRGPDVQIAPEDACEVFAAVEEDRIYLGARDRFGRFDPKFLARAIEGLDERARLNTSGGGGGLGLRRMVEQSDLLAVRVVPGKMTQMLCVVSLQPIRRRRATPKSLMVRVE